MIVKDEAAFIEKCLQSIKELADEIIIVDTGSTDETVQLCEKFNAKVYSYEWKDHFADARNYALSFATGDWILWLDGDEELATVDKSILAEKLTNPHADLYSLPVLNYSGESGKINKNNTYLFYQPRLFRNHIGITFQNRIHETLRLPHVLVGKEPEPVPFTIHHFGYLLDITERKNKGHRNITLLQQELAEPDHSPWIEYHLASEYYRNEQYSLAFQYVNLSIIRFLQQNTMPHSLLYKLKYATIIETGSYEGGSEAIDKALILYPDYVDLHFYKGYFLFKMNKYKEALNSFETCLELGDHHTNYLILQGTGSFKAWHYKGLCHEQLGNKELAEEAFKQEKIDLDN
ncbi:glycosyltransferase [Jeotgalibacillus sp. S-D1]|nr:glycosyltransferase [Jeotgalibacillus sp. S-D1]